MPFSDNCWQAATKRLFGDGYPGSVSRAWATRFYEALVFGTESGNGPATVVEALRYADQAPGCKDFNLDQHIWFGDGGVRVAPVN